VEHILKEPAFAHNRAVVVVTHERRLKDSADRVITIIDGKLS